MLLLAAAKGEWQEVQTDAAAAAVIGDIVMIGEHWGAIDRSAIGHLGLHGSVAHCRTHMGPRGIKCWLLAAAAVEWW